MEETPADKKAPASDSEQSRSLPSRLCQACLSVLARDDLALTKLYPHHKDLKGLIEASRMRCYICSWLLDTGRSHVEERLEMLAEGTIPPGYELKEKTTNRVVSDPRAELRDYIRNNAAKFPWGKLWDDGIAWVSFTGMKVNPGDRNQKEIALLLNPLYEGYFPSPTKFYDSWLRHVWEDVAYHMFHFRYYFPVIVTHQDFLELGLMTAELPSNTGSMATWMTVAEWVRQCSEQHQCTTHIISDWYPTRLVEIISNEWFRIVSSDSADFQPKGGYVTLSHRWGDKEFVKLTKSNLSRFERSFPVRFLRKTFQDAIVVAQRMDVPYLWIDSLCIIQRGDDGTDWRKESAKMAQVYSNSVCNISADWGNDSGGLFFERTTSFEPPCELQIRWTLPNFLSRVDVPSLPSDGGLCHIVRPGGWSENVMHSPLNRRGWVLQERQLASRILHFSPEGVSWECGAKTAWERTPRGCSDENRGLPECATALASMERLRLREPAAEFDWPRLLWDYTSCDLTEQSDRLVAVAGIAKVLASTVKDQYVAGIWSKTLPGALVWQALWLESRSLKGPYFAPSFSWAAAEGRVDFPLYNDCMHSTSATFIKRRKQPLSSSIGGPVRAEMSGQLLTDHIFGPIHTPEVEVRMQGILRSCRRVPRQLVSVNVPSPFDSCVCPSIDLEESAMSTCSGKGTAFIKYDRAAEEEAHLESILYYYTVISHGSTKDKALGCIGYDFAQGILLKSVDPSMGRFERVGYLEHERGSIEPSESENMLLPLGNERELPAWSYDETAGRHTFYIV